jgi:hypothetical protein
MSFKNYGVFVIRNAVYTLPSIDISLDELSQYTLIAL